MIDISLVKRILVAQHKVDFRKSFDGLLAEAYKVGLDPLAGDLVFFVGRCFTKIKIIFCDETGIWVLSKRFYRGINRKKFMFLTDPKCKEVDMAALALLIQGKGWKFETSHLNG